MNTAVNKLYAPRDYEVCGEQFARHMQAMTEEGLHSKSDVAWELAWRDHQIEQLRSALTASEKRLEWFDRYADGVDVQGSGAADDRWVVLIHHDGNRTEGATLREAIDEAMKEGDYRCDPCNQPENIR